MAFDPFLCSTATMPAIVQADLACENNIDQVRKIAFSLTSLAGFTVGENAATDIDKSAAWTTKSASADFDVSPEIHNATITPGDFIEEGDDNNINGIPQYMGNQFSILTGFLKNVPASVVNKLQNITALTSQSAGITQVKAYFIGDGKRITAKTNGDGFEVYNFVIKDVMSEGRRKPDLYEVRLLLKDGWSKSKKTFIAEDFDPLVAVLNPA